MRIPHISRQGQSRKRRRTDRSQSHTPEKLYSQFPQICVMVTEKIAEMTTDQQIQFFQLWAEYREHNKNTPVPQNITPSTTSPSFVELAVRLNQQRVIKLLPHETLQYKDHRGYNLAHIACELGHLSVLVILANKQPTLLSEETNNHCHNEQTPALIAASNGKTGALKYLLYTLNKINKRKRTDTSLFFETTTTGNNSAHQACANGHLESVIYLEQQDTSLFSKTNHLGERPVQTAISHDKINILQYFLEKNAHQYSVFHSERSLLLRHAVSRPKQSINCIRLMHHKFKPLFRQQHLMLWGTLLTNWNLNCDLSSQATQRLLQNELADFFDEAEGDIHDLDRTLKDALHKQALCLIPMGNKVHST